MTEENDEQKKIAVPSGPEDSPAVSPVRRRLVKPKDKTAINIRDYLSIFFKQKKIILTSFIVIIILASLYPLLIYKPKFQARSLLLVKFGWENVAPDFMPEERGRSWDYQIDIIQSEVSILKSRELLERVVNTLKPETIFPELSSSSYGGRTSSEAAMYLVEKDLSVTPEKGNGIMVTFSGDSPERSSVLVNQIVDTYIDRRNEIYKDPKSVLFLEKKADEYAQKLADAERRLKAFRDETSIISFEEQRGMLLRQQHSLKSARDSVESEKEGNLKKIAELDRQMAEMPRFSQTNETALSFRLRNTEQKILDLQLLERELATKYTEGNKLLEGARERLKIASAFMDKQRMIKPAEVADPDWLNLQKEQFVTKAEVKSADAKIEGIDQRLNELNSTIQAFEAKEQKSAALVRDVTDYSEKLRNYRQRAEEAKIFDELNRQKMTSVSVIERASPSNVPTNPFRPLVLVIPIVLAMAVLGSLGIGYLVEMFSHGLSTPAEAEKRLELPVLATIAVK